MSYEIVYDLYSLEVPIITVATPEEPPKMIFFAVKSPQNPLDVEIISYASMRDLSEELREKIRSELMMKRRIPGV